MGGTRMRCGGACLCRESRHWSTIWMATTFFLVFTAAALSWESQRRPRLRPAAVLLSLLGFATGLNAAVLADQPRLRLAAVLVAVAALVSACAFWRSGRGKA